MSETVWKLSLLDSISGPINQIKNNLGGLGKGIMNVENYLVGLGDRFFRFNQIAESFQNMSDQLQKAIAPGADFEQQIADLQAITGIAGQDLEKLSATARQVGKDTGLGASQAAEAFKLLASNIDVAKIGTDGLIKLQEETIKLAQASGVDLSTAANTMAATMNQFNLKAEDASRVINVLGAGAKYGASEVEDLAQSLKVTGGVASNAGVSLEESVGALEVMSQNFLKGAEAGTGLRNILLKLQTENIPGVDLKTMGLSKSLEALKPLLNDTTALSKIFGMENVNAAQILISNAAAVDEMTNKVTDTQVAYEQAAIRTETYNEKVKRIKASLDDFKITLFENTGSWLAYTDVIAQGLVGFSKMLPALKVVKDLTFFLGKNVWNLGKYLFTAIKGINLTAVASKIAAAAQALWGGIVGVLSGKIKIITVLQRVWNAVTSANPIMLLVTAVAALGAAFLLLRNRMNGITEAQQKINSAKKEALGQAYVESGKAKELLSIARDQNVSYGERVKALNKLKEISPEYFGNLTMETVLTKDADIALKKYTESIYLNALSKAYQQKIDEAAENIAKIKTEGPDKSGFTQVMDFVSYDLLGDSDELEKVDAARQSKQIREQEKVIDELAKMKRDNEEKMRKQFGEGSVVNEDQSGNKGAYSGYNVSGNTKADSYLSGVSGDVKAAKNINIVINGGMIAENRMEIHNTEDVNDIIPMLERALLTVLNDANALVG